MKNKLILALILVLFSVVTGFTAVRYLLDGGDIVRFDLITRYGIDDIGINGITGDDTQLWPDYGTDANKVCEGNDSRLPTTDEKAAMTGANSPSAANVFATEDDITLGDTGVELITTTSPIDDDGTAEQPNIIIASGYTVPTDAEKTDYDTASDKVLADSLVWADKYTQAEADALLLDKADTPHDHNNLYYTESEADALLLDKADTPHAHDDRYYTESESDALLLDKADTPHAHDDRYYTETEEDTWRNGTTQTEMGYVHGVSSDIQDQLDGLSADDSAVWGNITGTLSNQTDLQAELDDKVALADSALHQHVEADITDLDKYTTTEVDDLLDAKVNLTDTGVWEAAAAEVNADSGVWEDKYTKVEADLLLDDKANQADTPNWNTAYGWGDHADEAYFDTSVDTLDDIPDGTTYKRLTATKEAYIDQDVTSASSPNFSNASMTGNVSVWTNDASYFDTDLHTLDDIPDGSTYKLSHNDFSDAYKAELDAATADSYLDVGQKAAIDLNTDKVTNTDDQTIDVFSISGNDIQLSLERDGEGTKTVDISGTTAVTANSAKNTNVPTELSVGTVGVSTVAITSDGGADDVTLPAATSTTAGMLTKAKWEEIVANSGKDTNVSTALSEGTRDDTTYGINSDGSSPDLILPQANTNEAGLLSGTKWNEIVANTLAKHSQNTDTDLDATFEATFVKKADTVNVLSDITSAGADIEDAVTKKHVQGSDTALGAMAENIDLNGYKCVNSDEPTADSDLATKYYVDNSAGGAGDMTKAVYDPNDDGEIAEAQLKLDISTINLWKNTQFNAFRIGNYEYMIDGYTNDFTVEDEGIDVPLSDTYLYDAAGDYYYQDAGVGAITELDYFEYADDDSAQAAYVSSGHHAITFVQTAQLDTAVKKWGTASLLLDGNSDYISCADSADWDVVASNTDDWTVDFWVKHREASESTVMHYVTHYEDMSNYWSIYYNPADGLYFYVKSGGVGKTFAYQLGSPFEDTDWHHIALCKVADEYGIYKDGVQVAYDQNSWVDTFSGLLEIGRRGDGDAYLDGHIDEIRIQHSNYFGAAPNATPDDTITEPTSAHQTDGNTKLLLHFDGADEAQTTLDGSRLEAYSESTIKQQGSYSLKGIAVITDSLNDTLTRTVNPTVDLTGKTSIKYDIYSASRTGSQIKIGIHDSGGTTTEHTANISSTGAWEEQTWDISAVTNANKDDIDSIIITIVNADAANTFYIDNMFGQTPVTGGGNMELYTSYYQIGLDSATVKAMILANKEPTSVFLTRTGTGTSLTEGVLIDSDVYNDTYYSFNYSADVSGESSDTCLRCEVVSDDTTCHIFGLSLLGLE